MVGARNGHRVGVALYEDVVVAIVLDYFRNLAEGGHGAAVDLVAARLEEHVVGKRDIDHAFEHAHVDLVLVGARERTGSGWWRAPG